MKKSACRPINHFTVNKKTNKKATTGLSLTLSSARVIFTMRGTLLLATAGRLAAITRLERGERVVFFNSTKLLFITEINI